MHSLNDLIREIEIGETIFFIGNGVSRLYGSKGWKNLAIELVEICNKKGLFENENRYKSIIELLKYPYEYPSIFGYCERVLRKNNNIDLYNRIITDGMPTEDQSKFYENLFQLKPKAIITTNIDEGIPENLGYIPQVINYHNIQLGNGIFYLHGNISEIDNIVFTRKSYIDQYAKPNVTQFLNYAFSYTVVFIGYGLEEFEIKYIVGASVKERVKPIFSLSPITFNTEDIRQIKYELLEKDYGVNIIPYSVDMGYGILEDLILQIVNQVRDSQNRYNRSKNPQFYYVTRNIINPVLTKLTLTPELRSYLDQMPYNKYFFQNINLPDWLPILERNGLLRYKHKFGLYYLPFEFLTNCAEQNRNHDLILDVLFQLKDDLSSEESILPINYYRFVKLCGLLKPEYAVKTVDLVKWCFRKSESNDMVLDQVGPFIKKLADGGYHEEIFDLFKMIFIVEIESDQYYGIRDPSFKYENYLLDDIYENIEEIILAGDTTRYFEHLVDQYNKALQHIYPRKADDLDWDDSSYISRPAIEDNEQNSGYSDQDTLIVMIRNLIDHVTSDEKRSELMNILLKKEYPVFKRFALYAITEYPNLITQYQTDLLITENIFNTCLQHEIHRVLELRYKELDTKRIDTIIEVSGGS